MQHFCWRIETWC